MKLGDIFIDEDMKASKKVKLIAEVVTNARAAYGNGDAKITAPEVHTVDGLQDLAMLSDNSKVAIAESEVRNIKVLAVEYTKRFEGVILDKKIEELIALNPVLANITVVTESEYL